MKKTERLFGLDLLRALAITGVMLIHLKAALKPLPPILEILFKQGWVGVDLFFVLSGYLIGLQIFNGVNRGSSIKKQIIDFWIKRWTRTIPLYYAVLFAYVVIRPALFDVPFNGNPILYLTFLQNYFPLNDFFPSWSLCIEEQFYFIFPLIFYVFRPRNSLMWLLIFLSISALFRLYLWLPILQVDYHAGSLHMHDLNIRYQTLSHLDGLSCGVFLASTQKLWLQWSKLRRRILGIIGVGLILGVIYLTPHDKIISLMIIKYTIISMGFSLMLIAVIDLNPNKLPNWLVKGVSLIAIWSYGMYLWNGILWRLIHHYAPVIHWIPGSFLFLGGTICLSVITYHLIERPGMMLRKYLIKPAG